MQMIYNQTLDQLCQRNDKVLCTADFDDSINNRIIISFFIQNLCLLCDQLFNYIGIIRRKCLAYFRSGVLGGSSFTDFDETIQGNLVPVLHIFFRFLNQIHLLFRIVDQGCKGTFIIVAKGVAEYIINFLSYCTGTVSQYMGKCLVFTVEVGHKVLCSLGQIQDRLKVDDLRGCFSYCRVNLCKSL